MMKNMLQRFQEAARNHRANIQKSLEHRLEVSRAKGNIKLISQLKAEKSKAEKLEAEKNYYN